MNLNNNDIVILIPAYNPTADLIDLTNNLIKENFKVVVVNDGSTSSESVDIFKNIHPDTIFLKHDINQGKGQALKTGFKYIADNIPCIGVVTADADGQHLLEDIINVASELYEKPTSLILGSRKQNKDMMLRSRIGNIITKLVFKLATNSNVYDTQTGLRGIPSKFLQDFVNIDGQRYEYEMNMLLHCIKNKIKIEEITIKTIYINNNKASSFKLVRDTLTIYKCMFKYSNLLNIFLFGISAVLSFVIDFLLLLFIENMTANIFTESISLLVSVIGARIISSLFNFFFNKKVVFNSSSNLSKEFFQYYMLVVVVMTINYLLLNLLSIKLGMNLILSKFIVEVTLFICNYIVQKFVIFKKS